MVYVDLIHLKIKQKLQIIYIKKSYNFSILGHTVLEAYYLSFLSN